MKAKLAGNTKRLKARREKAFAEDLIALEEDRTANNKDLECLKKLITGEPDFQ